MAVKNLLLLLTLLSAQNICYTLILKGYDACPEQYLSEILRTYCIAPLIFDISKVIFYIDVCDFEVSEFGSDNSSSKVNSIKFHIGMANISDCSIKFTSLVHMLPNLDDSQYTDIRELKIDAPDLDVLPVASDLLRRSLLTIKIQNTKIQTVEHELQNFSALNFLYLNDNDISVISEDAFKGLVDLIVLELSGNKLRNLPSNMFEFVKQIHMLHLKNNQLRALEGISKLQNIQVLALDNNNISSLSDIIRTDLPFLDSLSASYNPLYTVDVTVFEKVPNLIILNLSSCDISFMGKYPLSNLKNLEFLDLSFNNFSHGLPKFRFLSKVYHLVLKRSHVLEIETDLPVSLTIDLSENYITTITEQTFFNQGVLKNLNLSFNQISRIYKDTFYRNSILANFDLSHNKLISLNGSIHHLCTLQHLNLSHNLLSTLRYLDLGCSESLVTIDISFNKIASLDGTLSRLSSVNIFDISNNFIKGLTKNFLPPNLTELYLAGNTWSCDCSTTSVMDLLQEDMQSITKDHPSCYYPSWRRQTFLSNLTADSISSWQCPISCPCFCEQNEEGQASLSISCTFMNFTHIPQNITDYVKNHNEIMSNTSKLEFLTIRTLDFENNQLIEIDKEILHPAIKVLRFAHNRLIRVPDNVFNKTDMDSVTLSNNSWICDCPAADWIQWIRANKHKIPDVNETRCGSEEINENSNKVILELLDSDLCPLFIALYVIIGVSITALILTLAGFYIVFAYNKIKIQIWLYIHGFTWLKEEEIDEDKDFDAFISYNTEDISFVIYDLVPKLESFEEKYSLCLHYRDFQAGEYIHDNILNAVKRSRRTIVVLSKHFLQSEWCRVEFNAAYSQVLEDKIGRLIIIKYGELPATSELDSDIQIYLKTANYLEWGEKYFWEKLKYLLPKQKKDRNLTETKM